MSDRPSLTEMLAAVDRGEPEAAERLLPRVYHELRRLARSRLARERPGQSLDPTGLVHEAYMRLIEGEPGATWDHRGHFFAAAATAMRRILIERARRRERLRHGGGRGRIKLENGVASTEIDDDRLITLDDELCRLADNYPESARVVELRFFAGLTIEQTGEALGISVRTVNRHWAFAKAHLYRALQK